MIPTAKILNAKTPEEIFLPDLEQSKKIYKSLAFQYHPDRGGDNQVFIHIRLLYQQALEKIQKGNWITPNEIFLKDKKTSQKYRFKYKLKETFEYGDRYISENHICFLVKHERLYRTAIENLKRFTYKDKKMEDEFSKYLPRIIKQIETEDHFVLVISKTKDLIPASVILNHFKGEIDPKHVAWMLSCLHNLLCYLQYTRITNNAISVDSCFISPKHHSLALLDGWWYSAKIGEQLVSVPVRTFELIPPSVLKTKEADTKIDLELLKNFGRELLGDAVGSSLLVKKKAPAEMIAWLRLSSSGDAVKDYKNWDSVLSQSFGPRKFIPMDLPDEIY